MFLSQRVHGGCGQHLIGRDSSVMVSRNTFKFNNTGDVADLFDTLQEPAWSTQDLEPTLTFKFPSTFDSGEVPDDLLQEGTILTTATASNEVGSDGPVCDSAPESPIITKPTILKPINYQKLNDKNTFEFVSSKPEGPSVSAWDFVYWQISRTATFDDPMGASVLIADPLITQASQFDTRSSIKLQEGQTYIVRVKYVSACPTATSFYSDPVEFTTKISAKMPSTMPVKAQP